MESGSEKLKQFVFTRRDDLQTKYKNLEQLKFGKYNLSYTKGTKFYTSQKLSEKYAVLIGEIVLYDQPQLDNAGVVEYLLDVAVKHAVDDFFRELLKCSGDFCFMLLMNDVCKVFTDACSQFEIYFDDHFSSFSNSPLLLKRPNQELPQYLIRYGIGVGDHTGIQGIQKLRTNHYLDLEKRGQTRYFPIKANEVVPVHFDDAVPLVAKILSSTLEAFCSRQRTSMAITAGYDSRLLLAASTDPKLETFIYQHSGMPEDHIDIVIGKQLAKVKGVSHKILTYDKNLTSEQNELFKQLYMPRMELAPRILNGDGKYFGDALILNGNMGEIGRTYYGINDGATPSELAAMIGQPRNKHVTRIMNRWRESLSLKYCGKGNLLDLFYWEERMGNWAAKAKTEMRIATRVVSPMNNHILWKTVLGVAHKHRTTVHNRLFLGVLEMLDSRLLRYPINPGRKTSIMKAMVKLGIYPHYKRIYWKIKA